MRHPSWNGMHLNIGHHKIRMAKIKPKIYKAFEYFVFAHLIISITPIPQAIKTTPKIAQSPTITVGKITAIATKAVMILVRIETLVALLNSLG